MNNKPKVTGFEDYSHLDSIPYKKVILNLKNVEQIEVARSFSKKVQLKQFEPIDLFASYKAIMKPGSTQVDIDEVSRQLFDKCEEDVEKDLESHITNNTSPGF